MNDPTNSRYRYLNFEGNPKYRRYKQANQGLKMNVSGRVIKEIPAHGTYGELLFRPEWRAKREEILNRDKSCVVCTSSKDLQVHHRQYHFILREGKFKFPWDYPNNLLVTLCESCHKRGHSKYEVPTINI